MSGSAKQIDLPKGRYFLDVIADSDARGQERTWSAMPDMGRRVPKCVDGLGTVPALIDSAASCLWGCGGGDHRGEFLLGRIASSAYATIRLMTAGYYDEALSIVRTLGENANLLPLFAADVTAFERWKSLSEKERRAQFKPVSVRLALEGLGGPIPVEKERYSALSGYSIHASPDAMPQAHNRQGRPVTFGIFQNAGFVICLNELALPVAFAAVFAPSIAQVPPCIKASLLKEARELADAIGGVTVMEKGRPWFRLD